MTNKSITPYTVDPDQCDRVATQYDFQNSDFLSFSRPVLMTDNSHSHLWAVKKFGPNNYFDELTLDIADSSKVLKKSIRVSNSLDPDQD